MWARSTNTPFDWWLVLICCEKKILLASTYQVAGVTLQGSITSWVLLQHRILALHLHGSCSICAQVFKFSKWSQKGVFFLSNPLMTAVMIMVTPSLESGKQSYLTRLRFSFG